MKFTKEDLKLEEAIKKEWIITNGIGGYSSSTIIGANTRRYHGLLIAPLKPPAKRYLCLSKVDECIEMENKQIPLYTNICKNYISEGYKNQTSFEKLYVPNFCYNVLGINIEKTICMQYGKNTVCVYYKIKNIDKDIKLKIAPIINFRDFHSMTTNKTLNINQEVINQKVKIQIEENLQNPFYMNCTNSNYIEHKNDIFRNMFYIEEEKRGFYPEENHIVPGRYEIQIKPNEQKEITFVFSLEDGIENINAQDLIQKEKNRLDKIINETEIIKQKDKKNKKEIEQDENIKTFIIATDNFLVYRPEFKLHTIIAGYPWFLDWGRDSLISFEGLLLKTKRFKLAQEILLTFKHDIKQGLVPNGYSEEESRPLYNSADASLLLFEQINKYLKYTNDYEFIKKEFYNVLVDIIENYSKGIDLDNNNIYLDTDGLIVSGLPSTQNTWMDAKYNGIPATPRNGKAVEINSMWYNSLKTLEKLSIEFKQEQKAQECEKKANKCKQSFKLKFYNEKKKCLYDVIGDSKIRPNQLFSIGLTYPVIDANSKIAQEIFETCTEKLKNKYGLKTLAKGEENYIDIYEGNSFKRDMSYHQGITWPWLLGIYIDSLKNINKSQKTVKSKKQYEEQYEKLIKQIQTTFAKEIKQNGCIGSISELYDSKAPYLPKGAIAQAWSVAEIFRIN